jgi:hypothetical protein
VSKRKPWWRGSPDPDLEMPRPPEHPLQTDFIEPQLVLRDQENYDNGNARQRAVDRDSNKAELTAELASRRRSTSRLGEARPPSHGDYASTPYRADTVVDGWDAFGLRLRAASVRGPSHRRRGEYRQDDFAVRIHPHRPAIALAVADGVSAAPLSHLGATVAVRSAVDEAVAQLDRGPRVSWLRIFEIASWSVQELASRREREFSSRSAHSLYATTLTVAVIVVSGRRIDVETLSVGDSGGLVVSSSGRTLFGGGQPSGSEFYNETDALPRVPKEASPVRLTLEQDSTLLLGTDGALGTRLSSRTFDLQSLRRIRSSSSLSEFSMVVEARALESGDDATLVMISPEVAPPE